MRNKSSIELYSYWTSLRLTQDVPGRSQIAPAQIRHILADLFILENTDGPVCFRLAGTRICTLFARELRGSGFDSLWRAGQIGRIDTITRGVMAQAKPVVVSARAQTERTETVATEIVLLPLRSPDGRVDRIIGSLSPSTWPKMIEAAPFNLLDIEGIREIDPLEACAFHAGAAPTRPASLRSGLPGASGFGHALRRALHLRVLQGGRPD